MKLLKIGITFFISICIMAALSHSAFAVGVSAVCQDAKGAPSSSSFCADQTGENRISGANGLIVTGANILSIVAGIAAVIMIIIGGLQYALSAGDSAKVNRAKDLILYALIGLVIISLAQVIVRFVLSKV